MFDALRKCCGWLQLNRSCLLCHQRSESLVCRYCESDLAYVDLLSCQGNLLNLPAVRRGLPIREFDTLLSVADYQWPFSRLITQLKFQRKTHHAKALAELFVNRFEVASLTKPDCLIPVPLGPKRHARRKFNQAAELAYWIGKSLAIPVYTNSTVRRHDTDQQSALSAAKRKANMHDAFRVTAPLAARHIAIFDDVVTTGTTANALATTLKRQLPGCRIDLWTLCVTLARQSTPP